MKIGIIGAGFTGLTASYRLAKKGHEVYVFEYGRKAGGLAVGFTKRGWKWSLEEHYHHWFSNDYSVLSLAREVGQKVTKVRPVSSIFYNGLIQRFDTVASVLLFRGLSLPDKFRAGMVLLYLKLVPKWKHLEKITAKKYLIKWMGENSWHILWEPLFKKKFGKHSSQIPASWFWARIKKRTFTIAYPSGGFLRFANTLVNKTKQNKGKFYFREGVVSVEKKDNKLLMTTDKAAYLFDRVICTLPNVLFSQIVRGISKRYLSSVKRTKSRGAVNVLIQLKKRFFKDGTYWLNINDEKYPFLVVIEHTNFMGKRNYGGNSLIYVGNYLENNHSYFSKSSEELINIFMPYLRQINPDFSKEWISGANVFKVPFAQPIIPLNYSKKIIGMRTPLNGVFLANIDQVYPWDRGTNYAVELGEKVSEMIIENE